MSLLVATVAGCMVLGREPRPAQNWSRDVLSTDLVLDLESHRGVARITVAPAASRHVSLSVGDLQVRSVRSGGRPLPHRVLAAIREAP